MKEYKLGHEFYFEDKRLKVVVAAGDIGCNSCYLESRCSRGLDRSAFHPYHKYCFGKYRTDRQSVKFILAQGQK